MAFVDARHVRLRSVAIPLAVLLCSGACNQRDVGDPETLRGSDAGDEEGSSGGGAPPTDGTEPTGGGGSSPSPGAVDAGETSAGGGGPSSSPTLDPTPVVTPTPLDAELSTASGCAGVYNPDQLLTLSLELDAGDWSRVLSDTTYSMVVPAQMQCEDEPPLTVGVRRKRSGGNQKVGLKVDINAFAPGQEWYGLSKLSLENGVSEGDTQDGAEVREYVAEYLAWRLMTLSGVISGRAAFVALRVNGESVGVYVNVEQVDKRFLKARLGDDTGWLYKKSGGVNDGLKTHELGGGDNPFDDYFCFWESGNGCPVPASAELETELPMHLDLPQFLRFGAVNALIANTDGPLFKDNNYYHYDYAGGPRVYLPWDLDTAMKDSTSVFTPGGGGGQDGFEVVLFMHWLDDYTAILTDLLDAQVTQAVIEAELERASLVAGEAFDADPYVTGNTADAVAALEQYWTARLADVQAELP